MGCALVVLFAALGNDGRCVDGACTLHASAGSLGDDSGWWSSRLHVQAFRAAGVVLDLPCTCLGLNKVWGPNGDVTACWVVWREETGCSGSVGRGVGVVGVS